MLISQPPPLASEKQPNMEPIPGYRILEPLGKGGFGEVWKCVAPGGLMKAIKFVYGKLNSINDDAIRAMDELRAIEHIKSIRHPFLLSMERVECVDHELLIVMELADKSLHDLLVEHQAAGGPGIPRTELLRYMRETAEVLDLMNLEHNLQHLDIKPRNLFVVRGHVKVADFGLVASFAEEAPLPPEHEEITEVTERRSSLRRDRMHLSAVTPLYASPEIFQGLISQFSDQYSLAIVYQELLTGTLPFEGKNVRQLLLAHALQQPRVSSLPEEEQLVVRKALDKDPNARYATCTEFVNALEQAARSPSAIVPSGVPGFGARSGATGGGRASSVGPAEGKYLPGYQFVLCLHRDPNLEIWEARSPQGQRRLVEVLYGIETRPQQQKAIELLRRLEHPNLIPRSIVQAGPGTLLVDQAFIEHSLRSRYQERQANGQQGIPREELLGHLEKLAVALDEIYEKHQIHHLSLSPKSILLPKGQLLISELGLAQLLWLPSGRGGSKATARYSAPELKRGVISPTADQYSLAMIYQEMLTGHHAFRGRFATANTCSVRSVSGNSIAAPRTSLNAEKDAPNLRALSEEDRLVLGKALATDPAQRFSNCRELLAALRDPGRLRAPTPPEAPAEKKSKPAIAALSRQSFAERSMARARIAEVVASLQPKKESPGLTKGGIIESSEGLEARFLASIPATGSLSRFDHFIREWRAEVVRAESTSLQLEILGWKRPWLPFFPGKLPMSLRIRWSVSQQGATPDVCAVLAPARPRGEEKEPVRQLGRRILESLQSHLQGTNDRRRNDRVYWPHPVHVCFLNEEGQVAGQVTCQGKDLSPTGIGLYQNSAPLSKSVTLTIQSSGMAEPILIAGNVIRAHNCGNGFHEVGVRFENPTPPSD